MVEIKAVEKKKEETLNKSNTRGIKRTHVSESSNSDKETRTQVTENELAMVAFEPLQGVWKKVQKKKGKMRKLSEDYHT